MIGMINPIPINSVTLQINVRINMIILLSKEKARMILKERCLKTLIGSEEKFLEQKRWTVMFLSLLIVTLKK